MSRYEGHERRADHGWHLRKELNIGHLLTTIALVGGLFLWGHKMDVRVALVEDRISEQKVTDSRQDSTNRESLVRLDTRLDSIDGKLDRLIERRTINGS